MATSGGTSGGAGAIIGDSSTLAVGDAVVSIPADGSFHTVSCAMATPPAWMDTAGNIIEPGLYAFIWDSNPHTPATVPGLLFVVTTPANAQWAQSLGEQDAGGLMLQGVIALGSSDLPLAASFGCLMPTDVTEIMDVQARVQRLVWV